jgi:hypothetical protein
MPKRLDRLLVLLVAALLIAISWDAARRHGASHPVVAAPPPAAPVPQLVRLVPSSTAFLPQCPASERPLSVGPGRTLTLRFAGSRCHVPPLHLRAIVRDASGAVRYDGPALAHEDLSGNYAVSAVVRGALSAPCGRVVVAGSGLHASGTVTCP